MSIRDDPFKSDREGKDKDNDGPKVDIVDGTMIAGWKVVKKLGEGGFGAVFQVKDKSGKKYALKTEGKDTEEDMRVLKMEVVVLNDLAKSGAKHACSIFDSGRAKGYNFIVMTLVGKSLADLRKSVNKGAGKFTPGCAISLGLQCAEALEELHKIGYLHRDVKPANFAVAKDNPRRVLVLDFGMARKYMEKNKKVRKSRTNPGFRGTPRYAGLTCHYGAEMGRKDDLESWLYQMIEWTSGVLPWADMDDLDEVQNCKQNSRTKAIPKHMMSIRGEPPTKMGESCKRLQESKKVKKTPTVAGNPDSKLFVGCPKEYEKILVCIDAMQTLEKPNYLKLTGLLKDALKENNWKETPYDWEKPDQQLTG